MLVEDWPTLDVLSLRYIHRVIEHKNGNKTRAAALLGIDRRTLNRILARERKRLSAVEVIVSGEPEALGQQAGDAAG